MPEPAGRPATAGCPPVRQPGLHRGAGHRVSLGAAMLGAMILMPLYRHTIRGQDVIATGLLLARPGRAPMRANRMADRLGADATPWPEG
jgi:hypothetical protein